MIVTLTTPLMVKVFHPCSSVLYLLARRDRVRRLSDRDVPTETLERRWRLKTDLRSIEKHMLNDCFQKIMLASHCTSSKER